MSQGGALNTEDLPPDVATSYVCDVGIAVPAANTLNVFGAGGASTSGVGNTIVVTAGGSGYAYVVVTSALNPITLVKNTAYICKGPGAVNFVLPAAAVVGDSFKILGYSNLWTISQNAMQSIIVGVKTSSLGIAGSVTATTVSDGLELVCVTQNMEFYETQIQGNLTII